MMKMIFLGKDRILLLRQIPKCSCEISSPCNHWSTSVQTYPAGNLLTNRKLILNVLPSPPAPPLSHNNRQLNASSQTVGVTITGTIPRLYFEKIFILYKKFFSFVFYLQDRRCYSFNRIIEFYYPGHIYNIRDHTKQDSSPCFFSI